jgi:hypothetical protein
LWFKQDYSLLPYKIVGKSHLSDKYSCFLIFFSISDRDLYTLCKISCHNLVFVCLRFFIVVVLGFFGSSGVLTQRLLLPSQVLYHLSHTHSPFYFSYFRDSLLLSAQAGLDHHPPVYTSCVAEMTGACHCAIGKDEISLYLLLQFGRPGVTSNQDPSNLCSSSFSQVAKSIGMTHGTWPEYGFVKASYFVLKIHTNFAFF